MAEFEEKLNAILSDPKAMGQIMSIAKALGGSEGGGSSASAPPVHSASPSPAQEGTAETRGPEPGETPSPLAAFGDLDPKLVQNALKLFSVYGAQDDHKVALLSALQPFLKEERYAKVDRAVQIAKLSRLIRVAFQMLKNHEDGAF
ncbi:hypothetical protein SDC9_115835 [bioreactor metagenome]|uniref:Uncharacterized protein n=1 Tax=bioreactor metagenome TaxID=1076179 RepID=A0A645BTZ7_9ZZZZ